MTSAKRYIETGSRDLIPVQIFIDENLLFNLVNMQRTKAKNSEEPEDAIRELVPVSLSNKDINTVLEMVIEELSNYNRNRSISDKKKSKRKKASEGEDYRMDNPMLKNLEKVTVKKNNWRIDIYLPAGIDSDYPLYSNEQILERDIEVQEEIVENSVKPTGGENSNDTEEKPLQIKKNIKLGFKRMYLRDDNYRVVVYVCEKPGI